MKKTLLAAALAVLPFAAAGAVEELELDSSHTYPNFTVNHLGFSTLHGRFSETSGKVVVDRDGSKSSVRVVIKTGSVDTGHEKRDKHLSSADFFDVAKYPEMTYESTKVTFTGAETAKVEGNLTMHGVTRPVALDVTRFRCADHPMKKTLVCGFDAQGSLKRSEFGIAYGVPNIGDEITLSIEAEAGKPGPKQDKR
jgi:polyisoprenoid-binding protein YceI